MPDYSAAAFLGMEELDYSEGSAVAVELGRWGVGCYHQSREEFG